MRNFLVSEDPGNCATRSLREVNIARIDLTLSWFRSAVLFA
jgi:hypothetical protein